MWHPSPLTPIRQRRRHLLGRKRLAAVAAAGRSRRGRSSAVCPRHPYPASARRPAPAKMLCCPPSQVALEAPGYEAVELSQWHCLDAPPFAVSWSPSPD